MRKGPMSCAVQVCVRRTICKMYLPCTCSDQTEQRTQPMLVTGGLRESAPVHQGAAVRRPARTRRAGTGAQRRSRRQRAPAGGGSGSRKQRAGRQRGPAGGHRRAGAGAERQAQACAAAQGVLSLSLRGTVNSCQFLDVR